MNKLFQSKFFSGLLLLLLALSLAALFREVSSTIKVKREISRLEQQAKELESKNKDLKQVIEYLGSSAYMDKAARENLNLQAAGEIAVALPTKNETADLSTNNQNRQASNFNRWWNYFFGVKTN